VVDLTQLRTVCLVAAAEAVGEAWRLAVVRIVGGDVAPVTTFVRLHCSGTVDRALVAVRTLLGAPARDRHTTNSLFNGTSSRVVVLDISSCY